MKIDSYAIGMSSATTSVKSYSVSEKTTVTVANPDASDNSGAAQGGQGGSGNAALLMLSPEGQAHTANRADDLRPQSQSVKTYAPMPMPDKAKMNLMLLERIMQSLTGKRFRFSSVNSLLSEIKGREQMTFQFMDAIQIQRQEIVTTTEKAESYYEAQQMSFQAQGVVNTSDGRQINFDLNVFSSYEFSSSSSVTTSVKRLADPLVINFDGTLPEFTKDRYAFDLTIDGSLENIFMPTNGSGFLALDKNGNGGIDDGSELFGAATGDGFWELSAHDEDGNGWIDENDSVFGDLKIMFADRDTGEFMLVSLKDAGVGAIFLGSTRSGYEIKADGNELVGVVQRNGIFLNENGTAGSIHHIDLTY